jgi:hypothetical protein
MKDLRLPWTIMVRHDCHSYFIFAYDFQVDLGRWIIIIQKANEVQTWYQCSFLIDCQTYAARCSTVITVHHDLVTIHALSCCALFKFIKWKK